MSKHTPGPWEAWNSHNRVILKSWRVGERNTTPGVVRPIAVVSSDGRTGDEEFANAQLIAAAPELIEALRATVASLMNYIPREAGGYAEGCFKYACGGWDMWNCSCSICRARRAIQKAVGE